MVDIFSMIDREKIKHLRKEVLRISQEEAARRAGWPDPPKAGKQRWYGIESGTTGDPPSSTLIAVAKALNVTVDDILQEPGP